MKKVIFFVLFAFALSSTFALSHREDFSCSEPTNITNSGQVSGSISFVWDACSGGCNSYEVKYVRLSDGHESTLTPVLSNSVQWTNLVSGDYRFYFRSVCSGGVSGFVVIEDYVWN